MGVLEFKTLIIDADPQANATSGTGLNRKDNKLSLYDCFINETGITKTIQSTSVPNLDIVPSHLDLVGAEVEIINTPNREKILKGAIQVIREKYKFILIDCAPSLGLITVNALTAADSVIIPVQCEYFALEGLGKLLQTIKIIQARLNPSLTIEGFLLTMYDSRLNLANQVVEEVKKHFQDMVFSTIIHRNVKLGEAPSYGEAAIIYDVNSTGAINYLNLARELLQKHGMTQIPGKEKIIASVN